MGLPGLQPQLLRQLLALKKPLVLVLFHGGIVTLPPDLLAAPALALVSAGYPGLYGAAALADALFDAPDALATNRWGKTPVTWYSEAGWKSADFDMLSFDMAAPPGRTHRYYTGTPQFAFGHGLSYANTTLRAAAAADGAAIAITVTNAHPRRATDEVVMLYAAPRPGTLAATEPAARRLRALAAFERVGPLAPGAAATLRFAVTPEMAQVTDLQGRRVLREGAYAFVVSTGLAEVTLPFVCDAAACRAAPADGVVEDA